MSALGQILLQPATRQKVVADCVSLVDSEVASKGGLSGIAVKGAYGIIKRIKPGIVADAVERLVEDFAQQLDPFYQACKKEGVDEAIAPYLIKRAPEVAAALLKITDAKAERADNATLRSAYKKLRPSGLKHVEAAVPGIARIIAQNV